MSTEVYEKIRKEMQRLLDNLSVEVAEEMDRYHNTDSCMLMEIGKVFGKCRLQIAQSLDEIYGEVG